MFVFFIIRAIIEIVGEVVLQGLFEWIGTKFRGRKSDDKLEFDEGAWASDEKESSGADDEDANGEDDARTDH